MLTRFRAGLVIYVPEGDVSDSTRFPERFDGVFAALMASGCICF
ncbi:hypothetical protein GQE98_12630 [Sneathiella sp. DP05]|uniref:Uncharacterized protein n=1 Tax=Sneathiella litorea TaxID=2606216 RepID=A0A6L8W8L6_9PROT|nr:hypothetical protein [Sneathiella litorea]